MKSVRKFYTREHPFWPSNKEQALDEISDINDLLSKGGWNKVQRDWLYVRRKKLVKYVNDESYAKHTMAITKPIMEKLGSTE